ncbi:PAS domain S-box protein [Sedimentisphaera salicampi]|uniref:PAS domain S-box protein n=1 Tax=Sedimentisphaera salicampi TaxID=1941349 RepID=UPI000B9AF501|nr:transporter substrate-binding domain-containing protein [Sedimentisphaera salicampi]OXU16198.1 Wide host range VirA protein [Sedimentisphaera salicampi]
MNLKKSKYLILCCKLLFLVSAAGLIAGENGKSDFLNKTEKQWVEEHPVVKVAPDKNFAPIEFVENGEIKGFSGEYLRIISEKTGLKFKITQTDNWAETFESAIEWQSDMLSSAAYTEDRKERLLFSRPYVTFPIGIYTQLGGPYITNLRELNGERVAVVNDYAVENWLRRDYPEIKIVETGSVTDSFERLSEGKVEAVIEDFLVAKYNIAKHNFKGIKAAGATPYQYKICFGVRKDWPELRDIINKTLASLSKNETERINKKWAESAIIHHINIKRARFWLSVSAGLAALIIALILVWNKQLKSRVKQRTRELSAEKEKFKTILNTAGDGIYVYKTDGKILLYNDQAMEELGYSEKELNNLYIQDIATDAADRKKTEGILEKVNGQNRNIFRTEIIKKDGSTFPVEVRRKGFEIDGEKVFLGISRNIEQRERQQREQEAMVELFRLVNCREKLSELIKEFLPYLRDWAKCDAAGIRLKRGEDYPYYHTLGFSEDFVQTENSICLLNKKYCPIRGQVSEQKYACMCGLVVSGDTNRDTGNFTKSGSFWTNSSSGLMEAMAESGFSENIRGRCCTEGFESIALIPLRDAGEIIGLLQLNTRAKNNFDIETVRSLERTADSLACVISRYTALSSLRESNKRFKLIYEKTLLGYQCFDTYGIIREVNPAMLSITGCSREEMLGKEFSDFLDENSAKSFKRFLNSGKSEVRGVGLKLKSKTGEHLFIEMDWSAEFSREYSIENYHAIIRDVTERKINEDRNRRLSEQLHQRQKLESLGTLAGGIAHDFNNILTAIIGHAGLAKKNCGEDSRAYKNINQILQASDRAKKLVNQILTFSRSSDLQKTSISVCSIIDECLSMIKPSVPENVRISKFIRTSRDTIRGNESQLLQIISNLITNSIHAVGEKNGQIYVILEEAKLEEPLVTINGNLSPGTYIKLTVSDNGCGLDENTKEKIFEPFFTTKPVNKGTGMGLSVVHGIISSLGGLITIDSQLGKGTDFNIYFPQAEEQ